ncbi:hypothetical protein pEaSNUABM29_00141 [Erwinia phage pEa_SNUABM_29]|nr:hypothetical protein pEaSNUABM29_00141 [Erwinia phage pEa_SNUABM_29]
MSKNKKANDWAWRQMYLHSQPHAIRQHVLSLPTTYKPQSSQLINVVSDEWRTRVPVVSINKIHDDPLDGWFAHVSARNVEVEGYVSKPR